MNIAQAAGLGALSRTVISHNLPDFTIRRNLLCVFDCNYCTRNRCCLWFQVIWMWWTRRAKQNEEKAKKKVKHKGKVSNQPKSTRWSNSRLKHTMHYKTAYVSTTNYSGWIKKQNCCSLFIFHVMKQNKIEVLFVLHCWYSSMASQKLQQTCLLIIPAKILFLLPIQHYQIF